MPRIINSKPTKVGFEEKHVVSVERYEIDYQGF